MVVLKKQKFFSLIYTFFKTYAPTCDIKWVQGWCETVNKVF